MSDHFLELAVPLETRTLTLFIGTGFSKYLTDNSAPSWLELIVDLVDAIDVGGALSGKLLNTNPDGSRSAKFELYIIAQILELEYKKRNLDIRVEVTKIINKRVNSATINIFKVEHLKSFLAPYEQINVVTTNYDTLISDYILSGLARVFVDGSAIPKANMGGNVFHIHGSITRPESIVLTISDYFGFQHKDNYLSRKFFTLLQETTVLILGYSLGDFNLNSILNEAQSVRAVSLRKSDIYLVSREQIDPVIRDFYEYTYGVRVVDSLEINQAVDRLQIAVNQAKYLISQASNLSDVLAGGKIWADAYLKSNNSLSPILLQASILGVTAEDYRFQQMLIDILTRKRGFSRDDGAWEQYEGLADWLVEVGSLIDIVASGLADQYVGLVEYSFSYMSKELWKGSSWAAFRIWSGRFQELKLNNQRLLRERIDPVAFSSKCCVGDILN